MSLPDPDQPSDPNAGDVPANVPPPVLTGPDPKLRYTATDWLLFALGTLTSLASIMTFLLGTIALLVWFFVARPPRIPFLRGVGLGLALVGVVLLGGLAVCFLALGTSSSIH